MSLFQELYFMSASELKMSTSTSSPKKGAALRFMNEPKMFDGKTNEVNSAAVWLTRMDRLRATAKLSDEEILFVVGDYVTGKAETWWNVVGSKASTWEEFQGLFKKHYLSDQEDMWWQKLQEIRQGPEYPSVDDVSLKMQELFSYADNKSQGYQVRTFLNALKPNIAYEVERSGTPSTFVKAEELAKQVEKSLLKYGLTGRSSDVNVSMVQKNGVTGSESSFSSGASEVSAMSSMFSLVDKLEKLSINLVKLANNGQENVGVRQHQQGPPRRQFVCFHCNQPGHKKYDCPEFNQQVATGSNAVPLGGASGDGSNAAYSGQSQGKDNGRQ